MFNTHDSLIDDIAASNFDILSTANNHSMDRRSLGVDLTIDAIDRTGMVYSGTRKKGDKSSYLAIVEEKGRRIAFLACTFSLNGMPDPDDQVLECYSEKQTVMQEIDMALQYADAVIITPHWGIEYQHSPAAKEKLYARELLDRGATAVIGTHPHVIQPMEKYTTKDGRETVIFYSTGNFISSQPKIRKVGLLAFVGLSFKAKQVWVNGVRYSPTYMITSVDGLDYLENTSHAKTYMPVVSQVMQDPVALLKPTDKLVTNPQCSFVNY